MYKHIPINERKQNAQNFKTIVLDKKPFFNMDDNLVVDDKVTRKFSSSEFYNFSNKNKTTTHDLRFKNMTKSNKTLKIMESSQKNDFNNWNEQDKENFLKQRGRKLKDYLSGFINKNDNFIDNNEEEEENQMKLFSLDNIIDKKEEGKFENSKFIFDLHSKNIRNNLNEKRSRTSGPAHFNYKNNIINHDGSKIMDKIEFDEINLESNKKRKHTISYKNENLKWINKITSQRFRESYLSLPKIDKRKKTQINNNNNFQIQLKRDNTIRSNDSIKLLNQISLDQSSRHSNSINKKSVISISEHNNEKEKVTRIETSYITYLNKNIPGNKLPFKNLMKMEKEEEKIQNNQAPCDKRNFIKLKNVNDSLSDDENEDFSSCLIYPDSKFKEIWDYVILLITLYTLIYVPYDMAFINSNSMSIILLDLICDLIYIVDLVIQFLTAQSTKEDKYITSYYTLAKNYIFSWFVLDLTSSLPFNSIVNLINANFENSPTSIVMISDRLTNIAKLSRIYRMMRLIRLIKLIKIAKSDKYQTKNMNIFRTSHISNINRLFIFLIYFIIFNHMLACIWTFMAYLDYPNWISNGGMLDSSDLDLYITSIYFNLTTIFTIGYGDIQSVNTYERLYNIIIMCVGIMLYTFAVSSLSNLIQKRDEKTLKFEKNTNFLDDASTKFDLSYELYSKIRRCLKYDFTVNKEDNFNMLSNLPEIIKIEMINQMHKEMIQNFFFFKNTSSAFRAKILIMLKPMKAIKGDILLKENEFVEEMFFIKKGVLNVCKNYKEQPLKLIEIRKYEHFGEIFMLLHEKSLYDLVVKSKYAELYFMRKVDLLEIYAEYQNIFESILQKSTYNSLIILKRYKNMLRNINKRRSVGINKIEMMTNLDSRKSMFVEFLKKDEEKENDEKNINSDNYIHESRIKQNFGSNKNIVNENPLDLARKSKKFLNEDIHVIIENEEENEDENKLNLSPRFTNKNKSESSIDENSILKTKKKNLTLSESDSKILRRDSTNLYAIKSPNTYANTKSLNSTQIRSKFSEKIKTSNLPFKSTTVISHKSRFEKRRLTGIINPTNKLNLSPLREFKNNLHNPKAKPFNDKKRNHIQKTNSSLNFKIQDKFIRRNTLFIHDKINKNIINDSLNIKSPAIFYSNKFEKWTLLGQIRKLDNVFLKFKQALDQ